MGVAALGVLLLLLLVLVWLFGAEQYDRWMNRVVADPEAPVPTDADRAFHQSLFIADLHADTLKWDRDLLVRSDFGHVDLPRLIEGNVALQVFTIVTKSPIMRARPRYPGERCVRNAGPNTSAIVAALQGRPTFSLRERAYFQARRLKDAVERSREGDGPELRLLLNVGDLRRFIADRRAGRQVVGTILGVEGGHWIGDPAQGSQSVESDMRELFDIGVRMFAPTHRFDNQLSGASEGCNRYGLTPLGEHALETAGELGMAIDLAHISSAGLREALALVDAPPVVSHTGTQAGCEPPCRPDRNLSDEEIELILREGGLIGVGYWPQAVGPSAWRIADVMAHIMAIERRLGLTPGHHVAFGSDFDGLVTPFFDTSQLAILTTIVRRRPEPFDEQTVRRIAGINTCRFFARVLPGGSEAAADEICGDLIPVAPDQQPTARPAPGEPRAPVSG